MANFDRIYGDYIPLSTLNTLSRNISQGAQGALWLHWEESFSKYPNIMFFWFDTSGNIFLSSNKHLAYNQQNENMF